MPAANKRIPRNMARIEFLACREVIEELLSKGFDKRKIHTRLTEGGQFTMSYDAFCKVLIKASRNKLNIQSLIAPPPPPPDKPPEDRPAAPAPRLQRQPGIIKPETKSFPDPRTMNPNDSY